MARRIHLLTTPVPSVEEVADMLGVPSSRVKHIRRLLGMAEPEQTGAVPKGPRVRAGKKPATKKAAIKAVKKH